MNSNSNIFPTYVWAPSYLARSSIYTRKTGLTWKRSTISTGRPDLDLLPLLLDWRTEARCRPEWFDLGQRKVFWEDTVVPFGRRKRRRSGSSPRRSIGKGIFQSPFRGIIKNRYFCQKKLIMKISILLTVVSILLVCQKNRDLVLKLGRVTDNEIEMLINVEIYLCSFW